MNNERPMIQPSGSTGFQKSGEWLIYRGTGIPLVSEFLFTERTKPFSKDGQNGWLSISPCVTFLSTKRKENVFKLECLMQ